MTFTVSELVAPMRRVFLVMGMVVLNAVVIPAAAWGLAEVSPMGDQFVPGLVLATLGAGSAASLKAAQLAKRADLPLAVSVFVVLQLANIIAVPLWAGQVVTGTSISAWTSSRACSRSFSCHWWSVSWPGPATRSTPRPGGRIS
jgi:predicted Na+-dependent transporter